MARLKISQFDPASLGDLDADDIVPVVADGDNKKVTLGVLSDYVSQDLGLGTMAVQNASAVAITGGSVTGITDITVADGGTGASTAADARTNLGLAIGTNVQAYSANLDEYAAVNPTAAGLALLDDADASAQRTTLGLAIGTNVQAYDADLSAIAALTSAADKMPYSTGAQSWALADLTSFARTLLATASNSAFLTALGQIASSFVSYIHGGTGAVTRTLQAWMRERPVSVLDYYDAGDGSDYGPAFGRALTASPRVFWPDNASGYTISSAVSKTLTRDVEIDWNGQQITFSAAVDLAGTTIADTSVTLSANPARYATSVSITGGASSSVQAGDILNIQSSVLPFSDAPDAKQDTVRIRSVSGAGPYTLTLDAGLNFPWSSAESGIVVTVFRPVKVTHLRPNCIITQTDGDTTPKYAVRHTGLRDITIASPVIKGNLPFTRSTNIYRTGFQLYYCVGWTVTDAVYEALSYPMGVYGGTRNGMEINSKARYCRHSHADVGGFASDYRLIGLTDEDSFVALSTHPAFRCFAEAFDVRNNTDLTAWRCMGGGLKNGSVHTTDSSSSTPQIHSWTPNAGFEYIYEDADFDIDGVTFYNPNRSAADLYVHYGRIVRVSNTKAIDFRAGSTVDQAIFGPGNRFTGGKPTPQSSLVLCPARIDGAALLDAYEDGGIFHIDPSRSLVDQSSKTLYCKGQIFRKETAGTYSIRLHLNAFAGVTTATYTTGSLILKGRLQHESAGFFAQTPPVEYLFGVYTGSGEFVRFPTVAANSRLVRYETITATVVNGAASGTFTLPPSSVITAINAETATAIPGTPTTVNLRLGSSANGQQYVADVDVKAQGFLPLTVIYAGRNPTGAIHYTIASTGGTTADQDGTVLIRVQYECALVPVIGDGGTFITMGVQNPTVTYGGAGGDSYIDFELPIDVVSGVSSPLFSVTYELELSETLSA